MLWRLPNLEALPEAITVFVFCMLKGGEKLTIALLVLSALHGAYG